MAVSGKGQGGKALRILVVEDEYLIATDIAFELGRMGHEIAGPVATVDGALALIGEESLDGALIDANLGGASSAPVAEELKARSVPYVVVTGYGDLTLAGPELDEAPRVGKPFTAGALAAVISEHFAA